MRMQVLDTVGPEELSPREVEVLAAIGRRLTNAEIANELFISVRTVESHVASLRRKLGVDSCTRLIAMARSRRRTAIQLPQNSFVGRDDEVADLRALLTRVRWVTVVGPAGCGKTRLALEVAVTGVLVPVMAEMEHTTAGSVINSVAQAIGLATDSSADLLAACGVALAAEPYLLVLDDCDRVTDAVAEMVGELMARARSLTVLATSRSPLGGTDETVCALEPLTVADDERAAAVRLFLDRAAAADPQRQEPVEDRQPFEDRHVLVGLVGGHDSGVGVGGRHRAAATSRSVSSATGGTRPASRIWPSTSRAGVVMTPQATISPGSWTSLTVASRPAAATASVVRAVRARQLAQPEPRTRINMGCSFRGRR